MNAQPDAEIVSAHPYDLGEVMAGSFRALRRRPGLYFGLVVAVTALAGVPILLVLGAIALSLRDVSDGASSGPPPVFFVLILLLVLLAIVSSLAQLKVVGMLSLATKQLADGREPTLGGLWADTRGLMPRVFLLAALLYAVAGVVTAVCIGLVGAIAFGAGEGGGDGAALLAVVALLLLGLFLLLPLALFLAVRWLYVIPVLAIEGTTAFGSVRRSWRLTAGRFWRTLGYLLVAVLVVMVVQGVITLPGQAFSAPAPVSEDELTGEYLTTLIPGLAVSTVLGLVASIVTTPFMAAYQALMYVDAQRRADRVAVGYGPFGQTAPGQYPYGQQPPGRYPYGQQPPGQQP